MYHCNTFKNAWGTALCQQSGQQVIFCQEYSKAKILPLMKGTSSPQYLLFWYKIVQAMTQNIMDLYVTPGRKAGPEILRLL